MRVRYAALPVALVLGLVSATVAPASPAAAASKSRDSDRDGMPDRWEVRHHLNPRAKKDAKKDADRDGLTNLREYRLHGNPRKADSDGDGVKDRVEARLRTKLNSRDSDRDGIKDGNDDANKDGICDRDHAAAKGLIVSFDPATGALSVKRRNGETVVRTVTNDTEIKQRHRKGWAHKPKSEKAEDDATTVSSLTDESGDDPVQEPAEDDGAGDDNGSDEGAGDDNGTGGDNGTGDDSGAEDGDDDGTEDGDDDGDDVDQPTPVTSPGSALLVPGAVVLKIKVEQKTGVIKKIELA